MQDPAVETQKPSLFLLSIPVESQLVCIVLAMGGGRAISEKFNLCFLADL